MGVPNQPVSPRATGTFDDRTHFLPTPRGSAMSDDEDLSVAEFVEYCRTQAGLLAGNVETMRAELDELLADIDDELGTIRARLDAGGDDAGDPPTPPSTASPDDGGVDTAAIAEMESEVEEKQTLVEAKQARMSAFQDLAAEYTALAEELATEVEDGHDAMSRVVRFEADHDAPAYFPDRQTVCEAAAESGTE
jgi:hypothetical protein